LSFERVNQDMKELNKDEKRYRKEAVMWQNSEIVDDSNQAN
jgi:hypothetical protein